MFVLEVSEEWEDDAVARGHHERGDIQRSEAVTPGARSGGVDPGHAFTVTGG